MIYVKQNIPCKRRNDLELQTLECLWVEISVKNSKILFGLFYRPPDSQVHIWDHINQSLENALDAGFENIVVMGDFNENLLSPNLNKLKNVLSQNSLYQAITEPTFFCENSSSLLDPLIVNNQNILAYHEVSENILEANIRYHCPVSGILNLQKPIMKTYKRKIWDFEKGNYNQYCNELSQIDWDTLIIDPDLNDGVSNVTQTILDTATRNIPNKLIVVRTRDPPWMTSFIRRKIRKRRRLHKKAKKYNTPGLWANFRRIRNECVKLVKQAKSEFFEKQCDSLNSEVDSIKNWWKKLRSLAGLPTKSSDYPPILVNDMYIDDDREKANAFNLFFCNQSRVDDSSANIPNYVPSENGESLNFIVITQEEVYDQLLILDVSKATGPDGISPRFLKYAARELSYPLALLFNKSLQLCTFPNNWKIANVTPVFKNGAQELLSNYRPISLLSIMGKTMEKCVFKYVFNFLIRFNLITSLQSGFMPGDSTVNQLLNITDDIGKALDSGKEVRVVFCDISRAFDRVWHEGLLYKLEKIGIGEDLLSWFKNYLSERKQRVVIGGHMSDTYTITAGVPQGSILGPMLFLIFINDIVCDIACNIRLFADDTSLYIIVEDEYRTAEILNSDLDKIHQWSEEWLVNFNSRKTETITISRKVNKPHNPPIYMNEKLIQEVEKHKHLGLIFQEDGSWISHVNYIIEKASPRLNLMRKLKFKLSRNNLQIIYFSFIRPVLEYADVIWDNIPMYMKEQLENIQIEAARIVTGATKLCSKSKLYLDTGWESLSERRTKHKIIKFHEMFHGQTPQYLSNIVPQQLFRVHDYNTRRANNVQNIQCRTVFYQNSFLPSVIPEWNSLPPDIKFDNSKRTLKNYLNRNVKKSPPYYNSGCRKGQVLHARLRLNCSNLKDHLFQKNIVQINLCECGQVENNRHFLLDCVIYRQIRALTIGTLPNTSLQTLLFGNVLLSDEENENIFNIVQAFIIDSGRFGL